MTNRFNRIRELIDAWRKPPDVVPLKPRWDEQVKMAVNWVAISVIVSVLRFLVWWFDNRKAR